MKHHDYFRLCARLCMFILGKWQIHCSVNNVHKRFSQPIHEIHPHLDYPQLDYPHLDLPQLDLDYPQLDYSHLDYPQLD